MTTAKTYQLLKSSLELASELVNYSQILEQKDRKPIALKLLHSAVKINAYIYEAQTAYRETDVIFKLQKAKDSVSEAIYWLMQCINSKYFDENAGIIRRAKALEKEINANLVLDIELT